MKSGIDGCPTSLYFLGSHSASQGSQLGDSIACVNHFLEIRFWSRATIFQKGKKSGPMTNKDTLSTSVPQNLQWKEIKLREKSKNNYLLINTSNEWVCYFIFKISVGLFLINVKQWIENMAFYNTHETINLGDLILTSLPAGIFQDLSAYTRGRQDWFLRQMKLMTSTKYIKYYFHFGGWSKEMVN